MFRSLTVAVTSAALLCLVAFPSDAQQVASAPSGVTGQRHLVFMDEGGRLPTSAASILQSAAIAAKKQQSVTIEGRPGQAAEVKRELIRLGAPSESIVVRPARVGAVPAASDGLSNPGQRVVALGF